MPAGSVFMRFGADFGEAHVERLREKVNSCLDLSGVNGTAAYVLVTVVDELVCNILEHSRASWVELELHPDDTHVRLVIRDDGQKFDSAAAILSKGDDTAVENEGDRSLGLFMV